MRVQLVIDRLGFGGAEVLLADQVDGLRALGVEPSVTYFGDVEGSPAAARLRERGIEPALVPVARLLGPSDLRRLRAHLAATAPDVVHTHLAYADMMGGVAARSLRLPSVATLHVMAWEGAAREQAKHALAGRLRRLTAGRVVAVSEAGRAAYLARGWDRPSRVVTVRNGVSRAAAPAGAGAAVRAELGLRADEPVAAMLTVLRAGKGHDEAFAAVARLRADGLPVRLLVCGDGPERARLTAAAASELGDAVVMAGHRTDVMAVLDAADVLLHPTHVDALPTALIEALAAGTPVVATRVGGVPELVDDGVTGRLVPAPPRAEAVADALGEVLRDPGLRERMGAAGQARFAAEFTAEAFARRLLDVYAAAGAR